MSELYNVLATFDQYKSIEQKNESLQCGIRKIEEKIQWIIQHKKSYRESKTYLESCVKQKLVFWDRCINNQTKMLTFLKKQTDISFYEAMVLYEEL